MHKTLLLATGSIIGLCAGGASAFQQPTLTHSGNAVPFLSVTGANILYNQNSSDAGDWVNSQNFTSGSTQYNDQAADDFVVPSSQTWRITEVDVTGMYFNGSGTATSENVIFYKNKNGMPDTPVRNGTFSNLNGTDGPNFALMLPGKGLKLRSGHYWVSVIANMQFFTNGGQWGWEVNSVKHGKQAMWQNPGFGFGDCRTWEPIDTCYDLTGPDLMFALKGRNSRS